MIDPITTLTAAIDNAAKVANTPFFTTVIDKWTGFKISNWATEAELRKKIILDEYEKAKEHGITGVQFIANLRSFTNLLDTAAKSAKYIAPGKNNEIKMDNDFFWNTIEHSKTISNEEIQELIAKIIAGEYNAPGTYSMSTLQVLKMLGKYELKLFEKVCSLLLNNEMIPVELFVHNTIWLTNKIAVDFGNLQTLQSLGLVLPNQMTRSIQNLEKKNFAIKYGNKKLIFTPENEYFKTLSLPGFYGLSHVGKQILQHLHPEYIDDYFIWLKTNYTIPNYKLLE
jgi:hypothetical protein